MGFVWSPALCRGFGIVGMGSPIKLLLNDPFWNFEVQRGQEYSSLESATTIYEGAQMRLACLFH
jgi:hypothetical protein